MTNPQAVALIQALFSEKIVGVDADGNQYGNPRNAHFLDALRVSFPGLPSIHAMAVSIVIPEGATPEDYRHKQLTDRAAARRKFSDILMDIAMAITADESQAVPF